MKSREERERAKEKGGRGKRETDCAVPIAMCRTNHFTGYYQFADCTRPTTTVSIFKTVSFLFFFFGVEEKGGLQMV